MENVRKRVDVRLISKWEGRYNMQSLIAKPNFHSRTIFNENFVAVEFKRTEILLDKPIYVGFCVLDLSKTIMYDFHYNFMLPTFGLDNLNLLYMDTDSFLYEVKCEDFYQHIKDNISWFDTSDYDPENKYGIPQENMKKLGCFKDEVSGLIITRFVGLRSKMYAVQVMFKDFKKKSKGVQSNIVEREITFDDYLDCLMNNRTQTRTQCLIRPKAHKVQTIQQSKIALSPHDNKLYVLEDGCSTLAWGHYKIPHHKKNDAELMES